MQENVEIRLMGAFDVCRDGVSVGGEVRKSRKGTTLLEVLILQRDEAVPTTRLMSMLWSEEKTGNPENALKTMVSRLRAALERASAGLGGCVRATRGAYRFELLPGLTVDLYETEALLDRLEEEDLPPERRLADSERLLTVYRGDLHWQDAGAHWSQGRAYNLHSRYMNAVYAYIALLHERGDESAVCEACRRALAADPYDDRLHVEMMNALLRTGQRAQAVSHYRHAVHLSYRYLGINPSEELQNFYKKVMRAGRVPTLDLAAIRAELSGGDDRSGAFVCEYAVFRDVYNLRVRNLEHLGVVIHLAAVMLGEENRPLDSEAREQAMAALQVTLCAALRRGDIICRFAPDMYVMLLPVGSGQMSEATMAHVCNRFRRTDFGHIPLRWRIGPLVEQAGSVEK